MTKEYFKIQWHRVYRGADEWIDGPYVWTPNREHMGQFKSVEKARHALKLATDRLRRGGHPAVEHRILKVTVTTEVVR